MCKAIVYWETLGPVNVSFDMPIDLSIIPDQVQTARQDPPNRWIISLQIGSWKKKY